jgi:putative transposase
MFVNWLELIDMNNQLYSTCLTDEQWDFIKNHFPKANDFGRPREISPRSIVNAILYLLKAGCQWRMLPTNFPKWKTVFHYFTLWRKDGLWKLIYEPLREAERKKKGRESQPTAGCLDSQSVKTGRYCVEERSYDGGKKVTGRKRHLLVDTEGLPIAVVVTRAGASDHEGAEKVLKIKGKVGEKLELVWVDGTYNGEAWQGKIYDEHGIKLEEVKKKEGVKGWQLLARRWVVERSFGWITGARRLVKDYELKTETSEAMIEIRMISILLKRLMPSQDFSD